MIVPLVQRHWRERSPQEIDLDVVRAESRTAGRGRTQWYFIHFLQIRTVYKARYCYRFHVIDVETET